MEHTTGALLLQDWETGTLVGSIACLTSGDDRSWIFASLFRANTNFSHFGDLGGGRLDMSWDVAIRFAGLLQIFALQSRALSQTVGDPVATNQAAAGPSEFRVTGKSGARIRCTWPIRAEGVKSEIVNDQVELRFRSDMAEALARLVLHEIATCSLAGEGSR
jgi:hypothetical protein